MEEALADLRAQRAGARVVAVEETLQAVATVAGNYTWAGAGLVAGIALRAEARRAGAGKLAVAMAVASACKVAGRALRALAQDMTLWNCMIAGRPARLWHGIWIWAACGHRQQAGKHGNLACSVSDKVRDVMQKRPCWLKCGEIGCEKRSRLRCNAGAHLSIRDSLENHYKLAMR